MTRTAAAIRLVVAGLVAAGALVETASAPHDAGTLYAHLAAIRTIGEAVISPDGSRVAWVDGRIHISSLATPGAAPLTMTTSRAAASDQHGVAWSRDGSRLAFLDDAERPGQLQVYAGAIGERPRRLTSLTGGLASPAWSPDGSQIAFLFTENAPRAAGPLVASTPPSGVIDEHVYEQRLAVVDVASGEVRQLTPADLYVYDFDWAPGGDRLAVTAAHGSGDDNWYVAELFVVPVTGGGTRSILKPAMQIEWPVWSPDGRSIAFIGGLMSDESIGAGDVYVVPADGGAARNLTPEMHASATWPKWVAADRLLFSAHADGGTSIFALAPSNGRLDELWHGDESLEREPGLTGFSTDARGERVAAIRESFAQPPEVWAGPVGRWTAVTHLNAGARVEWGKTESVHWKTDGFDVQGWLVYPADFQPARRYPMIVEVHGGPSWAHTPEWPPTFYSAVPMSAAGYFVFLPNPRGSYGKGERFTRANVKDLGHGDLKDILAGVDEVTRSRPVDPARIGITGWSYGGFMSMWAVTQTTTFKAAVAGAGIANWQSYYGENLIDKWMIPFFGASVYDDPAVYARSSPITFIKATKAPTLVIVGDRDAECPAPQSFEFWHALKTLGVPTQLVVYPDEGHRIGDPEHRRDIARRVAAWFDEHLR